MPRAGGYKLERLIARGAHGSVYEAVHENVPSRRVAVKVLDAGSSDDHVVERFIREMEALGKVDHPNVVRVHGAGTTEDGKLYYAMELLPGPDLGRALLDGAPLERALAWLADAARGLGALHAAGLVHRDVKPANIVLGGDGKARVCDLGIARDTRRETALTEAGEVLGSLEYMSPEQAAGLPAEKTADVFGLGAILYRILTGRPPYAARTALEALRQAEAASPPRPSSVASAPVPAVLEALCAAAMAKDPARRPPDAASFAAALHAAREASRARELTTRFARLLGRARALAPSVIAVSLLAGVVALAVKGIPGGGDAGALAAAQNDLERAARAASAAVREDRTRLGAAREVLERVLVETASASSATSAPRTFVAARRRALLGAAEAALVAGDAGRARAHTAEAIAREPDPETLLRVADIELALENPQPALALAPEPGGGSADAVVAISAARFFAARTRGGFDALVAEIGALATVRSDARTALALLAGDEVLRRGDARAALHWTALAGEGAATHALCAEAQVVQGDLEEAREELRRATDKLTSKRALSGLVSFAGDEERVARARGVVLAARGELVEGASAFARASDLAAGLRAGRLAVRGAECLAARGDQNGLAEALLVAERRGAPEEASLLQARFQFSLGDVSGAQRAAEAAGPGPEAVRARARLAYLVAPRDLAPIAPDAPPAAPGPAHRLGELALGGRRFGGALRAALVGEARRGLRDAAFASLADARAPRLLARMERLEGHPQRALGWAAVAIAADPLDPAARLEEGLAALGSGPSERARARRALEEAVRLGAPPDLEALVALAGVCFEDREPDRGFMLALAALDGHATDRALLDAVGAVSATSEDLQKLVAERRARLEANEGKARDLEGAAERASVVGDPRRDDATALAHREALIAIAPTARRYHARAANYARVARYEESVLDEARATVLDGSTIIELIERARGFAAGSTPELLRERAAELGRTLDAERRLARAALLFALGAGPVRDQLGTNKRERIAAWREAAAALDEALDAAPAAPSLWALRGVFLRALGHDEEAERDLARARAAGLEGEAAFEYLFARSASASGDRKAALAHLDVAIQAGLDDVRAGQDARAGALGWFAADPEIKKKLDSLGK